MTPRCGCIIVRCAIVLALLPGFAAAADETTARDWLQIRGFGTFGVVHSSEEDADFVADPFQPAGAGYSHDWDAGVDSKLALQLDATFDDRLSAVVQVVSQRRYDGRFTPQLEWANVKWQVTPDFSVRAGRTVLATFLVSDTRLLGYANPWVRPPVEVYSLLPVTNNDGIDATWRFNTGATTHTTHLSYGRIDLDLPDAGGAKADAITVLSHTIERGALTVRGSWLGADVDVVTGGTELLFAGLAQFGAAVSPIPGLGDRGAQALALIERYRFVDRRLEAAAIGAIYDSGEWLLLGEWARIDGPELLGDSTTWALTAGRRYGDLMPYVSVADRDIDRRDAAVIETAGLPPPLAGAADALNAGLQAALNQFGSGQRSTSIGVRWDVLPNAAIKLQYDRVDRSTGATGTYSNPQPGFELGGDGDVVSVGIDVVF